MENINALDEIHKGSCMGEDAINFILDKVKDINLKKELKRELKNYQSIAQNIEEIYPKYDNGKPHTTGPMNKAMTWSSIEFETLGDKTTSNLAELLLKGVNMGIIEGRRILNKKDVNSEVYSLISKYVTMQEENVEHLKKFL